MVLVQGVVPSTNSRGNFLQRGAWRFTNTLPATCNGWNAVTRVRQRSTARALRVQPGCKADYSPSHLASTVADDGVNDLHYMRLAIAEAHKGAAADEVPVGAVLVSRNGAVLAAAHNRSHGGRDPLGHAELLCIAAGAANMEAWRLLDATLYVTLEPCPMCAGAVLQSRLRRLVYGAPQPRLGADGSWIAMLPREPEPNSNAEGTAGTSQGSSATELCTEATSWIPNQRSPRHAGARTIMPTTPHPFHPQLKVTRGVLLEECGAVMQQFFKRRRAEAAAMRLDARLATSVEDTK